MILIRNIKYIIRNFANVLVGEGIGKKIRYIVSSVFLIGVMFFLPAFGLREDILVKASFVAVVMTVALVYGAHVLSQARVPSHLMLIILLVHLLGGVLSSLFYFPDLGILIKFFAFVGAAVLLYTTLLVNNVFIVTDERGSLIPLYSVALAWVQVLIIMISIPFFSGIFKMPINPVFQNLLVLMSSTLLIFYLVWGVSYDPDIKQTKIGEKLIVSAVLGFITSLAGFTVSFIPSESFLKALFVSSVLMFGLGYVAAHYKNRLNKKMIVEYGVITLIFFFLVLLYKP